MADDADTANDYTERHNEQARANRVQYKGKSAEECVDCGEDIPLERREAIRGVQNCRECAAVRERRL